MNQWSVQDAKARFSEFLRVTLKDGPQMVTLRGAEAAVLIPADQWRRLNSERRPSMKELLLGDGPRFDLAIERREDLMRPPPSFED